MMSLEDNEKTYEENIKRIVLSFIQLDSDILLYKDLLIEGVESIDFSEDDAFNTLTSLIEKFSTATESKLEAVKVINVDILDVEKGISNRYDTYNLKTHEDVESSLEQPWKSSALRKLWKAINCFEFKEMWEDREGLYQIYSVLEMLSLVVDEDAHVPYVFVEEIDVTDDEEE